MGKLALNIGNAVYLQLFPPPPAPPTVSFGRLPTLYFPEKIGLPTFSYTLQTATSELPIFPTTTNVYFIPPRTASFLSLDEASKIAQYLGFSQKGEELTDTIYRFSKTESSATLDVNIINKTFSISFNLTKTPELLTLHPSSTNDAQSAVLAFLKQSNLLTLDLENGEKTFEFLKTDPPDLSTVSSLSEANFIRVNLFRQQYDDLPVLTANRKRGNVWFLVTGDRSSYKQIIAGEYHYFAIDSASKSTYPIKTAQQAWEDLNAGRAFIAQYPEKGNKITVRKIYLAYYDSKQPQGFMQPIVVFEGDGGFSAYVPAVTGDYYGSALPSPSPETTSSAAPSEKK
ncbi:MAG: hypothetical protein UT38_C0016G0004 [Microgenomates group bacterium GW2011_GWA2_39_19]|nr:MAG: hypothetical protein UT38_C0016G0004 [Microgenomates group bacterium GW2011_GWA2_39_19]